MGSVSGVWSAPIGCLETEAWRLPTVATPSATMIIAAPELGVPSMAPVVLLMMVIVSRRELEENFVGIRGGETVESVLQFPSRVANCSVQEC